MSSRWSVDVKSAPCNESTIRRFQQWNKRSTATRRLRLSVKIILQSNVFDKETRTASPLHDDGAPQGRHERRRLQQTLEQQTSARSKELAGEAWSSEICAGMSFHFDNGETSADSRLVPHPHEPEERGLRKEQYSVAGYVRRLRRRCRIPCPGWRLRFLGPCETRFVL